MTAKPIIFAGNVTVYYFIDLNLQQKLSTNDFNLNFGFVLATAF